MTRPNRRSRPGAPQEAAFHCERCGHTVSADGAGAAHRNHCSSCLWSLHVDLCTGDRRSGCRGLMEPIAVWTRRNGEWAIVHRCTKCGLMRSNRIAADDNGLLLMSMALRPLAAPPFPLDRLALPEVLPDGRQQESEENTRHGND